MRARLSLQLLTKKPEIWVSWFVLQLLSIFILLNLIIKKMFGILLHVLPISWPGSGFARTVPVLPNLDRLSLLSPRVKTAHWRMIPCPKPSLAKNEQLYTLLLLTFYYLWCKSFWFILICNLISWYVSLNLKC